MKAGDRRDFLKLVSVGTTGSAMLCLFGGMLDAFPLQLPPGVQLWSVKDDLARDRDATLRQLAEIGYREVELFDLPKSPADFRKACDAVGLKCVSGHFEASAFGDPKAIQAAKTLGLRYMIQVFPALRALRDRDTSSMSFAELTPLYEKISLDDYKWNAEQLNKYGEILKKQGLQIGYHNHAVDLKKFGRATAFETLIESTDAELVVFEMDCAHVIHAGQDPIEYLRKYPSRIELLHLKDLKPGYSVSTSLDTEDKDTVAELGSGSIDWKKLFEVAKRGRVKHCFVEQEGKMDHPPLESLAISYRFLGQL